MDEIETRVLALVKHFGGRATLSSELYHDLHIHGYDAWELLEAVHDKYSTTFEGFQFNEYFPADTEALPRIVKWLGFKDKTVGSFTVGHLAECVRLGKWFKPNYDRTGTLDECAQTDPR